MEWLIAMNIRTEINVPTVSGSRQSERGAALLTVLMISTLLFATSGALIVTTALSTRMAIDSTSELQAYYSAEAGLEISLGVLRGQVAPNSALPAGSKISFRRAVTPASSNVPSDTTGLARLSGWLNYSYTPAGASNPDRVALTSSYAPVNGMAYSVLVSDPDQTPIASGDPTRLLVQVTGYGPKGAMKQMELIVNRSNFDYDPVATILMRSADDGTPITFTTGNSAAKEYSGHDHFATGKVLPTFGATLDADMAIEISASNKGTVADPIASVISNSSLPAWLRSANQARAFLEDQKLNAISQGRYFSTFSGSSGSSSAPAFTFVDGDCNLDGGAGLLIVTGNLNLSGNPSFDGLILVLGGGSVNRNGGGNGSIYGSIVVAHFDPVNSGPFLSPTFNTNGGGNSTMQYDSDAVRKALNLGGPRVWGVREY
ncbi:MAG TPA: hypothetical protein DC047_02900 [Blastocatellia bacterium]|nr:hypothetical protein [Blastocatellia bacterium]